MNVLITGGCGFIGSHVAQKFSNEGHRIFILDDLSTGNLESINFKHVFFNLDAGDQECEKIFKSNKFDLVVHLALRGTGVDSASGPVQGAARDVGLDMLGLINMLRLSSQYKVQNFIFTSSTAVYGDSRQEEEKINEDTVPNPQSAYGLGKVTGEMYCKKWHELHGLNTLCLRISNVYGPGQRTVDESGAMAVFLKKMSEGKELPVLDDKNQIGDYIFIKDVADAIYRAATKHLTGIYNLSAPTSCLDNARLCETLSWAPSFTMEEGLKDTFKWYDQNYRSSEKPPPAEKHKGKKNIIQLWSKPLEKVNILPLVENILFFGVVCFLSIVLEERAVSHLLDYKLIYIVIMSAVYGLNQAVLASLLSCFLYVFLYLNRVNDISFLMQDIYSLLQLSLYLLVGLVLGYVADNYNQRLQDKDAQLKQAGEDYSLLMNIHSQTVAIKEEMREQILQTENSYGKVYSILTQLDKDDKDEVFSSGVTVMENLMKTKQVTIYSLTETKSFALLAGKSENKGFHVPAVQNINGRKDFVKVIETKDVYINRELLPHLPLLSAPIMYRENVVAIASFYSTEFENLNLHRQNLFKITANLIGLSLSRIYNRRRHTQNSNYSKVVKIRK